MEPAVLRLGEQIGGQTVFQRKQQVVGGAEGIHYHNAGQPPGGIAQKQMCIRDRDKGKAVLLVSLELDEVMSLSDRILVMYEGEIVGELDPAATDVQELGLYMAGAKRMKKEGEGA